MENNTKKCSFQEHGEIKAIYYCGECQIYMCNKCEIFHSKLLQKHQTFNIDNEKGEIFTGLCEEEDHMKKLEYFCKIHNKLCCAVCISKIKKNNNGTHKDCDVCIIEDIKEEKKNKIKENIKYLEEISNNFQEKINILTNFFEKIKNDKEEIKLKIQSIFTKIRNELNSREDELLLEIDKKCDSIYFNENIIKECQKLPNKIKTSLEKSKNIEKEYDEKKICLFINNCINIENNIKDIISINEKIKICDDNSKIKIEFDENNHEEFNTFINNIKNFGKLKIQYTFKEIENPWTNEKFKGKNYFYYTLKENSYLSEKTAKDDFMHLIKSSYQFKKNKKYKLQFIPIYKGGDFEIGFGDFNISTNHDSLRSSENSVSLSNEGLKINKIKINDLKIENGKKYEFIIDISKGYFRLNIDDINMGEFKFNFQDNIYSQASMRNIGNAVKIKTYESI